MRGRQLLRHPFFQEARPSLGQRPNHWSHGHHPITSPLGQRTPLSTHFKKSHKTHSSTARSFRLPFIGGLSTACIGYAFYAHAQSKSEPDNDTLSPDQVLKYLNQAILDNPENATLHFFQKGNVLFQLGRFQDALASYEQAIYRNPEFSKAYYNKGGALVQLGRFQEALVSYDQAIRCNPKYAEAYFNRGSMLHTLGRLEEALTSYDQAIHHNRSFSEAYYSKGLTFEKLHRLEEALTNYNMAIEFNTNNATAYSSRGDVLAKLGRFKEAIDNYDQAIRCNLRYSEYTDTFYRRGAVSLNALDHPYEAIISYDQAILHDSNPAKAYCNKGVTLEKLNRLDEALASYNQAILHYPNYATAYFNQGNVLTELGRFETALASYDEAIRCNPNYATAYYNRASVLDDLGRLDEALKSYHKANLLNPNNADVFYNQGKILSKLNRLNEALASYDQAILLNPQFAEAYSNRGIELAKLGRLNEALSSYDEAIRLNPSLAEAYSCRGNLLAELGRLEDALASHEQAISLNPKSAKAYSNRGILLAQLGRPRDALTSYAQAIRYNPDLIGSYINQGTLLVQLGRFDDALASYNQAIRCDPNDAEAYYHRGTALTYLGRTMEALASFQHALTINKSLHNVYSSAAIAMTQLGDYESATQYLQSAVELTAKQPALHKHDEVNLALLQAMRSSSVEAWDQAEYVLRTLSTADIETYRDKSPIFQRNKSMIEAARKEEYRQFANIPRQNSPLHTAIKQGKSVSAIRALLDKDISQLDRYDVAGRTPLLIATHLGRIDIMALLLDKGANPNISALPPRPNKHEQESTFPFLHIQLELRLIRELWQKLISRVWQTPPLVPPDRYETPLIVACRQGDPFAAILLSHYNPVSENTLDTIIDECSQQLHFNPDDSIQSNQDQVFLDRKISELVKFDVMRIRFLPGILDKYRAHLDRKCGLLSGKPLAIAHVSVEKGEIRGIQQGEVAVFQNSYATPLHDSLLTSWHSDQYLALRARYYLELLAKLKTRPLGQKTTLSKLKQYEAEIKDELWMMLEMASTYHIGDQILQGFEKKGKALDEQHKQAIINAYIESIVQRIHKTRHYALASGYDGHAFYVHFLKNTVDPLPIDIRIDNLGVWAERHQKDSKGGVYSYFFTIDQESSLKGYVRDHFFVKKCYKRHKDDSEQFTNKHCPPRVDNENMTLPKESMANLIYQKLTPCRLPNTDAYEVSQITQQVDNCVVENYMLGVDHRFAHVPSIRRALFRKEHDAIIRLNAESYQEAFIKPKLSPMPSSLFAGKHNPMRPAEKTEENVPDVKKPINKK